MTWPSSSGQVRALYEEEGRSISLVDSIRATHVDSSSDRERVHTTQFDMTAGDTGSEIGPEASIPDVLVELHVPEIGDMDVFGSQSDTETVDAVSEVELADESPLVSDPDPVVGEVRESAVFREAFRSWDTVDIGRIYSRRATVMRSPPQFLRRSAIRVAMKEITHGVDDIDERRQIRGWKLFFLLLRLLLFRPHRGGNLPKKNLEERFRMFIEGRWVQLLIDSEACEAASSLATRRRRRNFPDTIDRRVERAQNLVLMGEVSSARHALDGEPVAPGTQRTFDLLSDPERRPPEPYNPMPEFVQNYQAETPFMLDKAKLLKNLKCARRGAAAGPSGMTADHLKVVLENHRDSDLFHNICQLLVRAAVPREIFSAIRIGRLIALQKANGGIRGIVAGDLLRRLVARTMAQQLGPQLSVPLPLSSAR